VTEVISPKKLGKSEEFSQGKADVSENLFEGEGGNLNQKFIPDKHKDGRNKVQW